MLSPDDVRGLAKVGCQECLGNGLRINPATGLPMRTICKCCFVQVFRICTRKYLDCRANMERFSAVSFTRQGGGRGGRSIGRKNEEFLADYQLLGARRLGRGTPAHQFFKTRYVEDYSRADTMRILRLTAGDYWKHDSHVMLLVGRAFLETEPYALFPIDSYFATVLHRDCTASSAPPPDEREYTPVRPPTARAA